MTQNSPLQPPQSLSSAKKCFNCNSDDHWILHNVGFRAEVRKLCTSCVLKSHPTSFCPTCYNLHDPNSLNPPPFASSSSSSSSSSNRTLTCLKCSSVSHITCVPPNTPKSPYLCPPCSTPSFKFFDLKKPRKNGVQPMEIDGGSNSKKVVEERNQYFDEKAAKVFLLAARIAAISVNKVVSSARVDVDRRVREAALARKRAKEAIDHVVALSSKFDSARQQRRDVAGSGPGSSHGTIKLERNGVAQNGGGVGNGAVAAMPVVLYNGGMNRNADTDVVMKDSVG